MKYDSEGDTIFTKEYFSPYYPNSNTLSPWAGMVVLPNNSIVLNNFAGTSDDIFANNANNYLICVDSTGNIIWQKIYGTNKWERPESIVATPDGKIISGGVRDNHNQTDMDYTFQCHIFQVDSLGNLEWEWLSPVSDGLRDAANDMLLLDDGSLIVASGVGHEIQHASVNEVLFDRYVFKLNPQREIEWELTFPDTEPTYWTSTTNLVELSNGSGYVMAGVSHNPDWLPPYTEPVYGWLAKISPDGDSVWARRYAFPYSSPLLHQLYDMKETPDGGLILCGQAHDLADTALYYPQQGWLLKLDEHGCLVPGCHLTDATSEGQAHKTALAIYPNPTTDYLNFYVASPFPPAKEGALFRIIGSNGRLVKEFEAANLDATFIVPVWDLADGAYWLQYCQNGGIIISKQFQILK